MVDSTSGTRAWHRIDRQSGMPRVESLWIEIGDLEYVDINYKLRADHTDRQEEYHIPQQVYRSIAFGNILQKINILLKGQAD